MAVRVRCPHPDCGKRYSVAPERVGQQASCANCGRPFTLEADAGPSSRETVAHQASDTAAPTRAQPPPRPQPQRLGRFEIQERLGAGAFGAVFRAWDPQLEREVALKVPQEQTLQSDKARERFLREAKAAAQLRHPHIVPVYDAGPHEKTYYIASAFIEGQTLESAIERDRLDFRRAAALAAKLADALAYAHAQGIIHRDVKPANVMLDRHGEPHVMDFGLARLSGSLERMTHDGTVLGTPAYMSPEQARGDQAEVGPAADQYSLGMLLYELLTRRTAFSGPAAVVIVNVIHQPIPAPRALDARIPRDLETVCLKALEKDPSARYPDCAALAADLRRWLEDRPILARRLSRRERLWRWCRRNPLLAATSVAAAAGLLAVTGVSWVSATSLAEKQKEVVAAAEGERRKAEEAERQRRIADERTAEADRLRAEAQRSLAEARRSLFAVQLGRVADVAPENPALGLWLLNDPERCPVDLRDFTWRLLRRQCQGKPALLALPDHRTAVQAAAFSADGRTLVTSASDVLVWDAATRQPRCRLNYAPRLLAVSSDGRIIAVAGGDSLPGIQVWDVSGGTAQQLRRFGNAAVTALAVSPDWTLVATGTAEGRITLWDADGATQHRLEPERRGIGVSALAFSPDGATLVAGQAQTLEQGKGGAVRFWDVATRQPLPATATHYTAVACLAFDADGRTLVSASGTPSAFAYRSEPGELKIWMRADGDWSVAHSFDVSSGAAGLSPDGRTLATVEGGEVVLRDVELGIERGRLSAEPGVVTGLAFAPDGRTLAMTCAPPDAPKDAPAPPVDVAEVQLWNAGTGGKFATLRGTAHYSLRASPDGRLLAATGFGPRGLDTCVWEIPAGREVARPGGHVVFSPDGTHFAALSEREIEIWTSQGQRTAVLAEEGGRPDFAQFVGDGTTLFTRVTVNDVTRNAFYDLASGRTRPAPGPLNWYFHSFAISPSGTVAAVIEDLNDAASPHKGPVTLCDPATWEASRTILTDLDGGVRTLAFSPDGRLLAMAGKDGDPVAVELWDVQRGTALWAPRANLRKVERLAVSPDGTALATGGSSGEAHCQVQVWHVGGPAAGQPGWTAQLKGGRLDVLEFSPDAETLVGGAYHGNGRQFIVWDVRTGTERRRFSDVSHATYVAGGLLATFSHINGEIMLWDLRPEQNPWEPAE